MRPSLVIPRIRANCPTLANRVAGAADFTAAATADDVVVPCAFVIPGGDSVDENDIIGGGLVQEVIDRFTVIVCVSNTTNERGQDGMETIFDIRDELLAALVGWSPDADHGVVNYAGADGDPSLDRARIWHGFDFFARTTVLA